VNRINKRLQELRDQGRKAVVPYLVSGHPTPEATLPCLHAMVEAGADILEIGIPFSDPFAEGPVIQLAHEVALAQKSSLRKTLAMVAEFRKQDSETPIVLMGYANPVEKMGYDNFVTQANQAGIDGVLTVDLPPEEAHSFTKNLKDHDIENIFLIAPTTTVEREKVIIEQAGGYIYYVSLKGVTGAGHLDVDSVNKKVTELRALTQLPVCVGFGIKDGETAKAVCEKSDGAVVGSVIVNSMAEHNGNLSAMASAVGKIVADIRTTLDA
jgi:tryptophan synthase alpha chain